jgi:hypothetical protein
MLDLISRATAMELVGTALFLLAIIHTFSVKYFQHLATKYPEGSVGENFYHLVGEVEIVFGLWAGLFLAYIVLIQGTTPAIQYLEARNFTEPGFVFVIMAICATRPVLQVAGGLIELFSKLLPVNRSVAFFASALVLGPLLGSFITEPAAMTVTALLLLERIYSRTDSLKLKYAALGLLFVNVSIGGTLTPFAAPPVLMVAGTWNWDLSFMLAQFGWKAALAVTLSTAVVTWRFRRELSKIPHERSTENRVRIPFWVIALHLIFLALVVLSAHHMVVFFGLFLFFLGVVTVTREYQDSVRLREGLLVAFFLGGLVVLGGVQRWWLEPLLTQLSSTSLFIGATGLTAITDNAALTFLGAQVPGLSDLSKYALVAGAVTGGGLTVIANAPNPAGYGILNSSFGEEGISPLALFGAALPPTILAGICFWFL